ncbi:MAG: hypothetical protein IKX20_08850 [Paludibacteraceae bacterium]|nr:hypothetical protein [Paludibacteraceae bacterium]
MNSAALTFSSSAVAFIVGVGMIPQTSTETTPYAFHQPMRAKPSYVASQTASSKVEMEIMIMRRIGAENYQRLQEISQLSNGWDGYNAKAIPQKVISRTKELLMMLPDGAKIFPTGRSTVQIEYHKDSDNYFELEVSNTTYEMYSVKGDDEYEDSVTEKEIINRVKEFLV